MKSQLRSSLSFVVLLGVLATVPGVSTAEESSAGGRFVPLPYSRLVDTSLPSEGSFAPGQTRTYQVTGKAGVPVVGVEAVLVDVAATSSTSTEAYFTLWTAGQARPAVSSLRFGLSNVPRSNTVVVIPNSAGQFSVYNSAGNSGLNIDVQGYFTEMLPGAGDGFTGIAPTTVLESYSGTGVTGGSTAQISAGATLDVQVAGRGLIPNDAASVFANIQVSYINTDGGLFITEPGGICQVN